MASVDDYVRQMRAYGYGDEDIRARLVAAGYSSDVISRAVYSRVPSPKVVVLVVAGVLFVVLAGFGVFSLVYSEISLVVDASLPSQDWHAGDSMDLVVRLSSSRSQDVRVVAEVSSSSGALQVVKGASFLGVSDESETISLHLPDRLLPGEYVVRVVARGGSGSVDDSLSFKVVDSASAVPIVPIDPGALPDESVFNGSSVNDSVSDVPPSVPIVPVVPPVAGDELSLSEIARIASSDVDRGVALCKEQLNVDRCLHEVAKASNRDSVCGFVQDVLRRDSCLTVFALNGDFSVCAKMETAGLRKACEDVRRFNEENP